MIASMQKGIAVNTESIVLDSWSSVDLSSPVGGMGKAVPWDH